MSDSGPGPYCSDGNHCYQRERITELEAKLKAAEAWKAEARVLLSVATACRSYPDFTWSEFKERRDALLAQEGGDNG